MSPVAATFPPEQVTRELFFNVGGPHGFMRWGIYLFFGVALAFLALSLRARLRLWRQGVAEVRTDHPARRLAMVARYTLGQAQVVQERYAGLMHAALFYGFLTLFGVTLMIFVEADLTGPLAGVHFLHGTFYLVWSLIADLGGVVLLIGVGMAAVRRYGVRPPRLDNQPTDAVALALLALLCLTGFAGEAMRIAITHLPPFERFSPVGYLLARPLAGLGETSLRAFHAGNWWLHMGGSFACIGLMATGRLGHIVIATLNVYFGNLDDERPATRYTVPLIDPATFEQAESFGVGAVAELSWKALLDSDACTRCGRCQDRCPAWATAKPLSPKRLINQIQAAMEGRRGAAVAGETSGDGALPLLGGYLDLDAVWACTNCGACMAACPVNIEHVPRIIDLRRHQVLMEGAMAPELERTFMNLENHRNPYGFAFAKRGDWLPADLGVKLLAADREVDLLYFVGCAAAFDKQHQKSAVALLRCLAAAGLKVGILGAEEGCCGDAALRGGNEYLFQQLATHNLDRFAKYGVTQVVTTCPHGYNTLKKEYRRFAERRAAADPQAAPYRLTVHHHTELLAELVASGRLRLKESAARRITYHDPCFLGRYNDGYAAPRALLASLGGATVVEMDRHGRESFCCGAGGTRMWMEESIGTRINQTRCTEAHATGASLIATACPFCKTMLGDAIKELGFANLEVRDLAELLAEALEA